MSELERELTLHAGGLRALAARLVHPADVDDIVQEMALQALQRPPRLGAGLRNWLIAVLRHRASKHRRAAARRELRERQHTHRDEASSPLDVIAHREMVARLQRALLELPTPYQAVLLQRFFQGLTPSEIAAHSGMALATVKSQLQRGLALLRERLAAGGRDTDWRRALCAAFALHEWGARDVVAAAAGMMMTSMTKLVAGVAVAGAVLFALWPWDAALPVAEPVAAPGGDTASTADRLATPTTPSAGRRAVTMPAANTSPVRLRVVDAFDNAPLPWFAVRVTTDDRSPEPDDALTTNERGEIGLPGECRTRRVTLVAVGDDEQPGERVTLEPGAWPAGDTAREVAIAAGPTYTLLFDAPPPAGIRLGAALTRADDPRWGVDVVHGWVREGPLPWVRLDPGPTRPTTVGSGPWMLVVHDSGSYLAIGRVDRVRGTQPTPVVMQGHECGALRIEAEIAGRSGAAGVHATVYALGSDGQPDQEVKLPTTHFDERQSTTRLAHLLPGRYRVFVSCSGDQRHQEDVEVLARTTTEVFARFHAVPAHALEIVARSETRTRRVYGTFYCRRIAARDFQYARYVGHREDGATLYRCDALPDGEWEVVLEPTPDLPPWSSMRQTIRADVGSVEFVCLDRDAPAPGQVAIAVLDAATGKAVGGAGITTFLDGTQHMTIAADADGQASLGRYLAGQPLQVLVRSAGHAPAWITVTPASDAAAAATTVRLHPGWGTMLVVRQPDPDSFRGLPLAGVRVSIDGLPAGTTDRHGMLLLLTHTGKPHRIDLQHAEFVVHYGSIDAATGAPDGDEALPFFVVMRRR